METIKLDLVPGKKMPSLHASQFDDGREHGIDLFENGVVYKLDGTETLTINERKGDDCICSLDIENTFTGSNHIVFASTEQMCAVWGNNICELVIAKGEKTIGTLNFILEVEPSPTENGIESESEIRNLERQIEEITEEVIGDDYYTAEETDEAIATAIEGKADTTYVDTELDKKADKSNTYTKTEVDEKIDALPEPMIFKGTLGVGGTIQTLPTASASNEGWMFKCITAGTYAGLTLKVGDTVTCFNPPNTSTYYWDKTGSQDTDTDTWRAIKVNGVEKLGNGISSGAVDFVGSENIDVEFDSNGNKVGVKTKNIYTKTEVDSIVSDAIYNVLPDDTASGSVANFNTSLALPIKSLEVDVNAVQNAGTPTPASPLPISGWSEITLVNCGNKYKPNIKPFSEWERARSDYYISRFSVPNTIITVNLIDKDTTVDLTGISFGYVDSNWNPTTPLTTTKYRWFIQGGTVQSRKRNISAGDASIILTGLIFYPATEATYNKLMARYDYEFVFSETANNEPYNTEVINLGNTYFGGKFTQGKNGNRMLAVDMEKDTMSSSYLSGLSSSYIGYVASVPAMNNHPCIWVRNWKTPPACKERISGGINAICNAFNISMNNTSIISTQYRVYFDVDGMGITSVADFISAIETMEQNGNNLEICYEIDPVVIDLPDGEPIITLNGTNNIYADTGDTEVVFKSSVNDYVSAHSGGNLLGMGGVYLGGAKSGGGEEETDEGEDTEKTKLDETKEEIKTIGDTKK